MATTMQATTLRLTATQRAQVEKLSRKLGLGRTDVIRFAIARLAEQEGITLTSRRD